MTKSEKVPILGIFSQKTILMLRVGLKKRVGRQQEPHIYFIKAYVALCIGYESEISLKYNDNCSCSYMTTNFPRLLDHASFIRSDDNALLTQKIAIERMCRVFSWL